MRVTRFNEGAVSAEFNKGEPTENVCGLVIHARPGMGEAVAGALARLPGVEVHAISPEGKLVVTAEDGDGHSAEATITRLGDIEGVVSVALVYHHFDTDLPRGDLP